MKFLNMEQKEKIASSVAFIVALTKRKIICSCTSFTSMWLLMKFLNMKQKEIFALSVVFIILVFIIILNRSINIIFIIINCSIIIFTIIIMVVILIYYLWCTRMMLMKIWYYFYHNRSIEIMHKDEQKSIPSAHAHLLWYSQSNVNQQVVSSLCW